MAFKGEIALGALNTKFKTGFNIGDVYRVQGAGNLVPNNFPVTNGMFVTWSKKGWKKSDVNYALNTDVEAVMGYIDAKGGTGGSFYTEEPDEYHRGSIIVLQNSKLAVLTSDAQQDEDDKYFFTYKTTDLIDIVYELENRIHTLETV